MRITLVTTLALTLAGALVAPARAAESYPVPPVQYQSAGEQSPARATPNDAMWGIVPRSSRLPLSSGLGETVSLAALLAGAWLLSSRRRSGNQAHWTSDSFDY